MPTPRVRIAPSPTGNLHVGTARAALFNYLFARHTGGAFILRIEDTDLERSDPKFEKNIIEGLAWLGIIADEDPVRGGPYAPYRQSERRATYKKYITQLLETDCAFYCFHSERELAVEKEELIHAKRPALHLCEFRTLPYEEARLLQETKPDCIIRFKTPVATHIAFDDLIKGLIQFDAGLLGDFSIAKNPDTPLYNFAVVVDDADMQITHVIRGDDHLSNTPKQMLLIEALGFAQPQYAHLPLILGPDRTKLSKRHGTTSIEEYRAAGYLPEALFNFIALLGWNPGHEKELFIQKELIEQFSLERVQKSGAVFDSIKLDWMNGEYIRKTPIDELAKLAVPYIATFLQCAMPNDQFSREYIERVVALEQPRLKKLSEIGERVEYFFREPEYDKEVLRWKQMNDTDIRSSLEAVEKIIARLQLPLSPSDIETALLAEIGEGDRGRTLWPLRVALTGKKASPGPFEIIAILGKEATLERIRLAQKKLGGLKQTAPQSS